MGGLNLPTAPFRITPEPPMSFISPPSRPSYSSPDHALPSWSHTAGVRLLTVLFVAGDAVNLYPVVALAQRGEASWMVWLLVIMLSCIAYVFMAGAGRLVKARYVGIPDGPLLMAVLPILGWLIGGLVAFYYRVSSVPTPGMSVQGLPTAGTAVVATADDQALRGAIFFLGVYLALGIAAFMLEFFHHNPRRVRVARSRREARAAVKHASSALAVRERAEGTHRALQEHYDSLPRRHQAIVEQHEALAAEARAWARLEMARHLGEPSDTSGVTVPAATPLRAIRP